MHLGNSLILLLSILNSLITVGYSYTDNTNYPTTQISSSECYDNYGQARVSIHTQMRLEEYVFNVLELLKRKKRPNSKNRRKRKKHTTILIRKDFSLFIIF